MATALCRRDFELRQRRATRGLPAGARPFTGMGEAAGGHNGRKAAMAKAIPTEHQEQKTLVRWLKFKRIAHAAVPNGFFTNKRDAKFYAQIKKLKDEGYSPGFPDLLVFKLGGLLLVEMKRKDGGSISKEQKDWHKVLTELGHKVVVCSGFEEAKTAITEFIEEG